MKVCVSKIVLPNIETLDNPKTCAIHLKSVSLEDEGEWSCTLTDISKSRVWAKGKFLLKIIEDKVPLDEGNGTETMSAFHTVIVVISLIAITVIVIALFVCYRRKFSSQEHGQIQSNNTKDKFQEEDDENIYEDIESPNNTIKGKHAKQENKHI